MVRQILKRSVFICIYLCPLILLTSAIPAVAQQPQPVVSHTTASLNVRTGPGTTYPVITTLPEDAAVIVEGHNGDRTWIMIHTPDQAVRGWVSNEYVNHPPVFVLSAQHVIIEWLPTPIPTEPPIPPAPARPRDTPYSEARVSTIDLTAYPAVGRATSTARTIYLRGQAVGRNPHQLAKVGDCFTEHEYFLKHFTWQRYDLGPHTGLQPVIDQFSESMDDFSYAAASGFLAGAVLMPMWADPQVCLPDESPLACEYRVHNPSVAIIMFGEQDVLLMTAEQFDADLRAVVRETIDANIVPILSTFPIDLHDQEKSVLYNKIVVRIALDYDLPLINFWLALEALPNHGVIDHPNHFAFPDTDAADLNPANMTSGYPVRNLVTLQTLDAVWRGAMQ
ncbi:MAG: SH3 domain-containing protein [Anaerolineae bacterium]|nr:SH3 domain-containing protein [Anaerolineae bacterium]